jgi:hypothetical protein
VDGSVDLQNNGTFSNASLELGSTPRTGCVGSFTSGTFTIFCGGTAQDCSTSGQCCEVTLTRTAATCP